MNNSNKYIFLIFVSLIVFISTIIFLIGVDITFEISRHPIASLFIKGICMIMLLIALILRNRDVLLYFFILSFPFMRIMFVGITLLTAFAVILGFLYRKEIIEFLRNKRNPYGAYFIVILFCLFLTTLISKYPLSALPDVVFFISLAGIYYVVSAFMNTKDRLKILIQLFLVVFGFCIVVSFIQLFFGVNSVKLFFGEYNNNVGINDLIKRVPSVFWEAQGAGQYFAVMVTLLLGIKNNFFKESKWLMYGLVFAGVLALLLTKSRIAIFVFIFSVFLTFFLFPSIKRILFLSTICVGLLILTLFPFDGSIMGRINNRFSQQDIHKTADYRYLLWKESIPIALHNPWGVGLGADNLYRAAVKDNVFSTLHFNDFLQRKRGIQFENSYLQILYSLGFLGLLAFLMILFRYFSLGTSLYGKNFPADMKKLIFHQLIAMTVWLSCIFTSPQFLEPQPMIIFMTLLALMNSTRTIYLNESETMGKQIL
ncbi:MAG: O-antigen ligase family protein [Candidatus Omnitrophica bacterium]|nr:O-antigen ligase family protein [Candidatus Omnitrophota bacterium]